MSRGFVYLVAVVDWFSRRVLSHRVSITMEAGFCVEALEEALGKHGKPEIFNSDQGSMSGRRPSVKGSSGAMGRSRVRSCLRPVRAGYVRPAGPDEKVRSVLSPYQFNALAFGACSPLGFQNPSVAHITPSVTLDACSPWGEIPSRRPLCGRQAAIGRSS
jgi:hypothetical protein